MERKVRWRKQTLRLKDNHTWKAPSGYNVFVLDRGAVRFNFPKDWVTVPASDCVALYDRRPPNDNCRLAVSYLRLPPMDWTGLPLDELIASVIEGDQRRILARGDIIKADRADLELAWREIRFQDPSENCEAFSRIALARGANLQALITFDFWARDAAWLESVWDEVMRTVELGRFVSDPTAGDTLH